MDCQRFRATRNPDGPDVVGCNGGYAKQDVVVRTVVRTWNNAPRHAVPMFHQSVVSVAVRGLTDGPHVVCRDDSDAIEEIVAVGGVRTPHERPACAVPMFSYGAVSVELRLEGPSDRPNIIIRHRCDRRQTISLPASISAGNNFPIGGSGRVGGEQAENDKNGCMTYFHCELFLPMANNKVRPRLLSGKACCDRKGRRWHLFDPVSYSSGVFCLVAFDFIR